MKNRILLIIIISLTYSTLFNSNLILTQYKLHQVAKSQALTELFVSYIYSFICCFIFFYSFAIRNILFAVMVCICFALGALVLYFEIYHHVIFSSAIIGTIFEANFAEVTFFLEPKLFIFVILAIILGLIFYKLFRNTAKKPFQNRISFMTGSFVFFAIFADGNIVKNFAPYSYFVNTLDYIVERFNNTKPKTDISKNNFSIDNKIDDLIIVVVIGESARGDHFEINGYYRETTPLLAKTSNLISFKNATSCDVLTRRSVPCMLTRGTRDNKNVSYEETSLISVFRKLGFSTIWLANQGTYSIIDHPVHALYKESETMIYVGANVHSMDFGKQIDDTLLPFYEDFLNKNKAKKSLIILHTYGNHWHYEDHYPDTMQKYHPICSKKMLSSSMKHCTDEERINSYDNAIYYTDSFLKNVIRKLENKNAILIYASDHGESLGENGIYGHGIGKNIKEQYDIPIIFWFSEQYIKNYPENYQAISTKKDLAISHDYIFHSILGCGSISSQIIISELNLCRQR